MSSSVRALVALVLISAVAGCGSGGVEPGFPSDVSGPAPGPPVPKDAPDMKTIMQASPKKSGSGVVMP